MGLSPMERQANIDTALMLFMEEVGDQWIRRVLIDPASDTYKNIGETTWIELQNRQLIRKLFIHRFSLTGSGWRTGLELTSQDKNNDTQVSLGRICASLRAAGTERSAPSGNTLISTQDVASDTGHACSFIANVIDGELIDHWLNPYGATWADDMEGKMIAVPPNFGLGKL